MPWGLKLFGSLSRHPKIGPVFAIKVGNNFHFLPKILSER
jgi:hypothetical protein